jgi:hypothetical protein
MRGENTKQEHLSLRSEVDGVRMGQLGTGLGDAVEEEVKVLASPEEFAAEKSLAGEDVIEVSMEAGMLLGELISDQDD